MPIAAYSRLTRRQWLANCSLLAIAPRMVWGQTAPADALAAAWAQQAELFVGWVRPFTVGTASHLEVLHATSIPTRAHGMAALRDGSIVFASRRPGDWLLRLRPGRAAQWQWIESDRAFNGHVIESADGRTLYTTETDLANSQGLIGVRDARSLEKIAEWPTGGMDPHQLLLDGAGLLVVANGGIPTQPETGRRKLRLEHIDSSIAQLNPEEDGAISGQWRLADSRLSLRHLAWGPRVAWAPAHRWLGIALQAEHTHDADRARAPVVALWDGQHLHAVPPPANVELAGYGGDIGSDGQQFAVSCPRADLLTWWQAPTSPETPGVWQHSQTLEGVYCVANRSPSHAIADTGQHLWVGARQHAARVTAQPPTVLAQSDLHGIALDNHWIPLPPHFAAR